MNGEFTVAYAPYGYLKDPKDKHHLIIDVETAPIVKRIFEMAAHGSTAFKIERQLTAEKILTPRANLARKFGKYKNCFPEKYSKDWGNATIMAILRNRVYSGHMVANKSTTKSFKNRKQVAIPESERIEIKNTHSALVDEPLFNVVQKMVRVKKETIARGA